MQNKHTHTHTRTHKTYDTNKKKIGWQKKDVDMRVFFLGSVAAIVGYRVISGYMLARGTQRPVFRFCMQLLDLEIYRAIYVNYILNCEEPSNPQRWIQSLEAAFEAGFFVF